jgi:hypothetical protein
MLISPTYPNRCPHLINVFEVVAVNSIHTIQYRSIDFYDFGRVADLRWLGVMTVRVGDSNIPVIVATVE